MYNKYMNIQTKCDFLKTEFLLTQQQMDKYDQLSTTIKAWAITLWAASTGWAFQVNRREVFLLSIVIILMFWFFDALNKTFRQDYKKRRDEVSTALSHFFQTDTFPPSTISPRLPLHRRADIIRSFLVLHIALPYFILTLISFLLYI
jgi:hypothetical protein